MSIRLNITMDTDLYKSLKRNLPPKKISLFINQAVRAKLFPNSKVLDAAYQAAQKETWRKSLAEDWEPTEYEVWPE